MEFKEKSNCIKDSVYIDDGYTGTNFDRPSFKEMSSDIEKGLVKTVIVKDLSRFGRNYIEAGSYSEMVDAETEFEKYRIIQDKLFMSDFDRYMLELSEAESDTDSTHE